jgi:hypothetical protein
MKIMVPKNVSTANNFFLFPLFYICKCFIGTCMRRCQYKFPCNRLNVGTFHILYAIAGLSYLIYADDKMLTSKIFNNGALRAGGVLSASSSWMPSYTVENSILRRFTNDANKTTDNNSQNSYMNANLQSSWCAGFNETGEWI